MADAFMTATTHAEWIPEIWSKELIVARQSVLVLADLVKRFDADIAQFGDTVHVPTVTNLTAGNISTSDGSLDSQTPTETSVPIVIDKWKGVVLKILDITKAQSKYDFMSEYSVKMGYALGLAVEQDLAALAAGLSQTVGTFNTNTVSDANLRDAVQKLDDARVPFSDRHMFLKPVIKNALLGIDKFVRFDSVSYAKGESPVLKGNIGELYGVQVHISPEAYKTGNNTSNMMFHRDCLALAMQKALKIEQFARTGFLTPVGASELYGVKELRDDHGVEIRS
jgi:N4-gp56 family major capsid protein